MLAVIAGLKSTNIFELISRKMKGIFKTSTKKIFKLFRNVYIIQYNVFNYFIDRYKSIIDFH